MENPMYRKRILLTLRMLDLPGSRGHGLDNYFGGKPCGACAKLARMSGLKNYKFKHLKTSRIYMRRILGQNLGQALHASYFHMAKKTRRLKTSSKCMVGFRRLPYDHTQSLRPKSHCLGVIPFYPVAVGSTVSLPLLFILRLYICWCWRLLVLITSLSLLLIYLSLSLLPMSLLFLLTFTCNPM